MIVFSKSRMFYSSNGIYKSSSNTIMHAFGKQKLPLSINISNLHTYTIIQIITTLKSHLHLLRVFIPNLLVIFYSQRMLLQKTSSNTMNNSRINYSSDFENRSYILIQSIQFLTTEETQDVMQRETKPFRTVKQ